MYNHPTRDGYEHDDYRVYKARNVDAAARKMARFLDGRDWDPAEVSVDYEADHKGVHIDLYELGEQHPLYRYLP